MHVSQPHTKLTLGIAVVGGLGTGAVAAEPAPLLVGYTYQSRVGSNPKKR